MLTAMIELLVSIVSSMGNKRVILGVKLSVFAILFCAYLKNPDAEMLKFVQELAVALPNVD